MNTKYMGEKSLKDCFSFARFFLIDQILNNVKKKKLFIDFYLIQFFNINRKISILGILNFLLASHNIHHFSLISVYAHYIFLFT